MTTIKFPKREQAEEEYEERVTAGYEDVELREPKRPEGPYEVHYHKPTAHLEAFKMLAEKLKEKFGGNCISTKDNNLPRLREGRPTREGSVYRPDLIVCDDKESKKNIRCIVEIETDANTAGKSIAGAMVLANYCISKHIENGIQNPDIKPQLLFVILKGDPKLAEKRISAIEKDCKYLTIDICGKDEAMEKM